MSSTVISLKEILEEYVSKVFEERMTKIYYRLQSKFRTELEVECNSVRKEIKRQAELMKIDFLHKAGVPGISVEFKI